MCETAYELEELEPPTAYSPPAGEEIAAAEQAMGIRFPKDFLQFHRESEGRRLPFWEILDLTRKPKSATHIIGANLAARRDPPK